MWDYKKDQEQRSSQGKLREGQPRREQDGKEHLTGYRPHEQEGERRPGEVGRLENTFGDIAVGATRNKEVTVMVSRRRNQDGPTVREEEKSLKGDSAKPLTVTRGNFRINSHEDEKSALLYRQSNGKAPQSMVKQMRDMMEEREQETIWKQAPFLDRQPEKRELKLLRAQELELRRQPDPAAKEQLREIERRSQQLRRIIVEKEGEERRLRLILQKAREEAQQRGEETWEWPLRRFGWSEESEMSDEDADDAGEDEDNGEDPEEGEPVQDRDG